MHRGGTSLVARLLNLCGVDLGPASKLMKPADDNPTGFWEHLGIYEINEQIFSQFGGSWHEPPEFPPNWENSTELAPLHKRASQIINSDFKRSRCWAWKDPRSAMLLPFWRKHLPNLCFVLCVRNPLDVASSLSRRENFPTAKGIHLWSLYTAAALLHTKGAARTITLYESYFEDWRTELSRVTQFLGLPKSQLRQSKKQIESFIQQELWHHRSHEYAVLKALSVDPACKALYTALLQSVRNENVHSSVSGVNSETQLDVLSEVVWRDLGREKELGRLANELQRTQETSQEQSIRISQSETQVAELTTNRNHLQAELEQQHQEIERLADELEQKGKDLLEELTTSSELRGTLQELTAAANDLVAKIENIEGSRSWKLVQGYWKWKARWLPENSTRLRIYEKLARFVFRSAVVSNPTNEAFPLGAAGTIAPSGPSGSVIEQSRMSDITGEATQNNHNGCSEIPISEDDEYQTWLNQNWPRTETLREMRNSTSLFAYRPKISLITPVYNVPPEVLKATLNSIVAQVYDNWELCIVNDGSTLEGVRELLDDCSRHDTRVKVIHSSTNENISAASNRALSIATGEYVTFVDHDDLLAPHALFRVVEALQDKTFDLLYSDEDKLREEGGRLIHFEPLFKPGWSPDTLLSINYIAHLLVIRRQIVEQVGRFRSGFEGSQDHDLVLRCLRHLKSVRHIADILYHWRVIPGSTSQSMYEKPNVFRASEQALEQFWYTNYGIDAQVKFDTYSYRIDSREVNDGKVSIIIPFRDKGLHLLRNCVDSILRLTQYPDLEILLIAHQCREEETLAYLDELSARRQTIRYVRYEEPFNFQKVNNWAASLCKGRYLLFLNNDTEVLEPLWLNDMMVHAMRKDVGAVGPQLLFPDGTIQHAGVILGMTGFSGHVFAGLQSKDCFTSYGSPNWIRNYLAVTAACILIRKDVFEEVGGFDERLVLCGGDVDLCLRIFRTGRRIVYVPTARLLHFESQDRETFIPPGDFLLSWENYKPFLEVGDPYYNPNLSLKHPVPHIRVEEENMFEFAKSIVDKMQEEACKAGN